VTAFTFDDCTFMARALRLAERGRFTTMPNPRVGCVIVRDGQIVGEGFHQRAGEGHAEVNALRDAGREAAGATAYVTLEPCATTGRTPPCTDALIDADVAAVVFAASDPSESAAGQGVKRLEAAGIGVRHGLMASTAEAQNRGFFSRIVRGRPFVTLKLAASLDGAIAMASGESQWITGPAARADVQRLRAESGAVLTGIGTVLADDPSLTVRDTRFPTERQPLRVVADSQGRMPANARMLSLSGATLVASAAPATVDGAETIRLAASDGRVDLAALLERLGGRGINDLLVECGPGLAGRLLELGLVDELVIYQSPHIMGSETRGLASTPRWKELAHRARVCVTDRRQFGPDTRITARISH